MGTDGIDFLQGLDVPHLYKEKHSKTGISLNGTDEDYSWKIKIQRLLTMMVQSADPLYSLFLQRKNSVLP